MNKIKILTLVLLTGLFSTNVMAEVVVVVNANNSITSLSKAELIRIFQGKQDKFATGKKAIPVNQIPPSEARQSFDSDMLGRTTKQMTAYWSKQLFSGNATPPKELNGDIDVLKFILASEHAIGYVDKSAVNDAVKVITIN
ncbi:phosphate ABC transporter substrate-binding protein (plasmid) [Saccharobesus litoralis]|uniref:Phosphate ABC transporter substrate-binding protein n=1 Tax=Saccharobesus litoralis TaxID=2172099 RepID=A0A2S0VY44_9ALTE|nr:phosphate ABC transporter substrate-binding protein [Saccharobesus litoralis]AWB69131.1 phosphate ABC transporter substrate-binding protein [Saccharobesus litoralis]